MIFILKFTPAMVFLRASLGRQGILFKKNKAGVGEFVCGKIRHGLMHIKNGGAFILTENSKVMDKKSKTPVFTAFSEYAATIPYYYEETIDQLRKKGYKINDYRDYYNLVMLSNREYAQDWLNSIKNEKKKIEARILIDKAKNEKIEIKPFFSIGLNELSYMFPNNLSPIYIDAITQEEVNMRMRKEEMSKKILIYIGLAALIALIGAAIAWKMIKSPQPEVIVKMVQTGVETAKTTATNLTMG